MTVPHSPAASAVETTQVVLPPDTNAQDTAFGGRIMAWMDLAAAICAGRHSGEPVVTAAVTHLTFERPIRAGDVVIFKASINSTGRTSMEVGVRVVREDRKTRQLQHCLSGYFTFVAIDADGNPIPVPAVVPVTDEDKRRNREGKQRRDQRLAARA